MTRIPACSIGIMAYNEEANIGRLLDTLLKEAPGGFFIGEIIVVSSGSTDSTETIVRKFADRDPRVIPLIQKKREGKASAVNCFLARAAGDLLILESADTVPAAGTMTIGAGGGGRPPAGSSSPSTSATTSRATSRGRLSAAAALCKALPPLDDYLYRRPGYPYPAGLINAAHYQIHDRCCFC